MNNNKVLIKHIKKILDSIIKSEKLTQDEREYELNKAQQDARALPRKGILEALDLAIGKSRSRKKASIVILGELIDIPDAIDRLGVELSNPDWEQRHSIIQLIGLHNWVQFAPLLNQVILNDPDELCRREAIRVSGVLKQDVNWPIILELANEGFPGLSWTLKDYGREECRPYLRKVFEQPVESDPPWLQLMNQDSYLSPEVFHEEQEWSNRKEEKVIAAWGLAKLGDIDAILYLGEMLYDPNFKGSNFCFMGESLRAAQALADVFKLSFKWNTVFIEPIRGWWEENKDRILNNEMEGEGRN